VDTRKMVCDPDEVLWSPQMQPDNRAVDLVRDFYRSSKFLIWF
jgi:hypothetical protein